MAAARERSPITSRPSGAPELGEVVFVVGGRIAPEDVPGLCARACRLLQTPGGPLLCDVGAVAEPDAVAVEAVARLQLAARRAGRRVVLRNTPAALANLLALAGLAEVVPGELTLEPGREPEEREESGGVEEEVRPHDPPP